jgi:protein SCO1/2
MRSLIALAILLLCAPADAGEQPTTVRWDQRLGAPLPLDLTFVDETGRSTPLAEYFGSVPVVIVFAYFHCSRLCPEVFAGVREGLRDAQLVPDRDYRLLGVSIDPDDTPVTAERHVTLSAAQAGAHLLTSKTGSGAQLARAAGFVYSPTPERLQFAHPAGFVIATPRGTISRYFFGVRYSPDQIRAAMNVAADDRTGSLTDRLVMLCSGFDLPHTSRSVWILSGLRIFAVMTFGALAIFAWRTFARRTSS